MTELVVCSGKGGTGKTSVVAGLASLAEDFVLVDCDVDAANLHLVLNPAIETSTPFIAGHTAQIRQDDCAACGKCHALCRFSAIDTIGDPAGGLTYEVDPLLCDGCGVCVRFCPTEAIDFPSRRCGEWYVSHTLYGPLVHAALDVGAENSGKLVSMVREQARSLAERSDLDLILVDGPPGIGCPVTAALTGADLTLLVTEPSLSGLHDLRRIVDLADHFRVPAMVCINKYDLSPRLTRRIEEYCREKNLPVIGRIPFEPLVNDAQTAGRSLIEFAPQSEAAHVMTAIWHRIECHLADSPLLKLPEG
ncbi:MAG: P-loop NTPase [Candidatus Krumholzibacteriota bacterium]